MPCSLWRNGERMADLVVPFPVSKPGMVCGMLRISERFTDVREIMQTRVRIFPGAPVFVHHVTDEDWARAETVALSPMSTEQARGAPPAEQFELRDEHGEPMVVDSIWIRRIDIPEGAGEFPKACQAVGLSGVGWMIIASPHGEQPAREV
jgi:hypothetical protein